MNYALAKELKDAGFPFISCIGRPEMATSIFQNPDLPDIPVPTIEELCGALGDKLQAIVRRRSGYWVATHTSSGLEGDGQDPYEALARLWLLTKDE